MKNTFNKRVRPRVFKEGNLVLKKRLPNVKDSWGKWAPNYEGSYVVKQAFSRGALVLAYSKGQELIHPVWKFMEKGWVRESKSPYDVLMILVPKKDESWRICMENSPINAITIRYR
ncbi:hypothetical protein CR513_24695, partial [Mucuna pruriens]